MSGIPVRLHIRDLSEDILHVKLLFWPWWEVVLTTAIPCSDVAMNPGPVMLGSVNVRSIQNKGPLLSNTIASHAFDFLCLTETHIRTTDSDSFLHSLTPDGFSLIQLCS